MYAGVMDPTYYTLVANFHIHILIRKLLSSPQDDPSLDMISEETALKILPGWLGSVMRSMWLDRYVSISAFVIFQHCSDPIVIGGSYVPYCLGYLTGYNDVDIFMDSSVFPKFLMIFKAETKNFGHIAR